MYPVEAGEWSSNKWTLDFSLDEVGRFGMALSKKKGCNLKYF